MDLKNRLRDIETDCRDRLHDLAPPNRGGLNSAHIHGTPVPGGGAVHSIMNRLTHCNMIDEVLSFRDFGGDVCRLQLRSGFAGERT